MQHAPRRFVRPLLVIATLGAAAAMSGCAVYPAGYGYYGGDAYGAPPVYINGSVQYSDGPRGGYGPGPGRGYGYGQGPRGGWRR